MKIYCFVCIFLCIAVSCSSATIKDKVFKRPETAAPVNPESNTSNKTKTNNPAAAIPNKEAVYTVPVKLTSLSGSSFSVKTQTSCSAVLADSVLEIPAGVSVSFAGNGNIVNASAAGKSYKQTKAVLKGKIAYGAKTPKYYNGAFEITAKNGRLTCICIMNIEEYTSGVLACESIKTAPEEAQKAQAVVIRTYAFSKAGKSELCDTSHCQNYRGITAYSWAQKAAKDTEGVILVYNGVPITSMYSADSGGVTEDGGTAYLKSKKDPVSGINHIVWNYSIPKTKLADIMGMKSLTDIKIEKCTVSGRVKAVRLYDRETNESRTVSGDKLRSALGYGNVKSTLFTVAALEKDCVFSGRGYGHGKGLCQRGCMGLAEKGWNYKKILSWYYDASQTVVISAYKKSTH